MKGATKWILGIAGTMFLLGLILRTVGFAMGGRAESQRYFEAAWENQHWSSSWERVVGPLHIDGDGVHIGGKNGIHVDSDGVDIGGDYGIHVGYQDRENLSGDKPLIESGVLTGITSVEADLDCGDLWIQEGDAFSLSLDWNLSNYSMSYQVEGGTLKVMDESWGRGGANDFNISCKMLLTIPAGTALESLELSTNLGDIEVNAAITAEKVDLSTALGDITCRDLNAKELEVESELGDVTLTIPPQCEDLSYSLSTDLGEVFVNGQQQKNTTELRPSDEKYVVEAKTSLGNISLEYAG